MADIDDGDSIQIQGSAKDPYVLKNVGGVYSCTCPAWRNQSSGIERRTCKHLRQYRGEGAETERLGALPAGPVRAPRLSAPGAAASGTASGGAAGGATGGAPKLLLAHSWSNDVDLKGWWISEKLDGVRAYWDGQQFISRLGNVFMAPDWFVKDLPTDTPLDGELWLQRKEFERAVSIVRRQDRSPEWKQLTYVVFDAPHHGGAFEQRVDFVASTLKNLNTQYARAIEHTECDGLEHMLSELARVEALGGEGLMLRKPRSRYEPFRSSTLLKVKTFHDAEAVVVDHLPGEGKHTGRLGALAVKLPDGTRFSVGTGLSDFERSNPPAIGSIIRFRYQELSKAGVPRFPTYGGRREDMTSPGTNLERKPAVASVARAVAASKLVASQLPHTSDRPADNTAGVLCQSVPTIPSSGTRLFQHSSQPNITWEISVDGCLVTTTIHRRGSTAQRTERSLADEASALRFIEIWIAQRLNNGFVEVAAGPSL